MTDKKVLRDDIQGLLKALEDKQEQLRVLEEADQREEASKAEKAAAEAAETIAQLVPQARAILKTCEDLAKANKLSFQFQLGHGEMFNGGDPEYGSESWNQGWQNSSYRC